MTPGRTFPNHWSLFFIGDTIPAFYMQSKPAESSVKQTSHYQFQLIEWKLQEESWTPISFPCLFVIHQKTETFLTPQPTQLHYSIKAGEPWKVSKEIPSSWQESMPWSMGVTYLYQCIYLAYCRVKVLLVLISNLFEFSRSWVPLKSVSRIGNLFLLLPGLLYNHIM